MTANQRLKEVIEYLKREQIIYNQQDFVKKVEKTSSVISEMITGSRNISEKFAHKVSEVFPDISKDWLMSGEGEMIIHSEPHASYGGKKSPKPASSDDVKIIPLLPISAQGGSLNQFFVSVKDSDCEHIVSPIKGADFAISVAGESMAPEYPNGSQILIKKINHRAFIEWGRVYVLDTCNGTVIKTIVPGTDGCLRCESINPDPKFAPFEIYLSDIIAIYRVMMCMSLK